MSDRDSKLAAPTAIRLSGLVIEAGGGGESYAGEKEGALHAYAFRHPFALCRYGDALIVADVVGSTIKLVEGVLEVDDPMANSACDAADLEDRAIPLIMAAIPIVPKELARLTAQYAFPIGRVRIIAGDTTGHADGPALHAQFDGPISLALDTTDPVAGPQLIIGQNHRVRCLNLTTRVVSTIAGSTPKAGDSSHSDGPASQAQLHPPYGLVVGPNGAVYFSQMTDHCVRRLSPAAASASAGGPSAPSPASLPEVCHDADRRRRPSGLRGAVREGGGPLVQPATGLPLGPRIVRRREQRRWRRS
jgi:hypothetical protein